jgi:hypothetical protein
MVMTISEDEMDHLDPRQKPLEKLDMTGREAGVLADLLHAATDDVLENLVGRYGTTTELMHRLETCLRAHADV